ncbi:MAG: hypothetical protein K0R38_3363 [Polyangiaceae bacterium]|jgi:hypothetical protein|nr:hypothetical protein [Polyangiaceae bacterium]
MHRLVTRGLLALLLAAPTAAAAPPESSEPAPGTTPPTVGEAAVEAPPLSAPAGAPPAAAPATPAPAVEGVTTVGAESALREETGAAALLGDDQSSATDSLTGETLKVYGFGDVGYRQMLVPKTSPWLAYFNRHPSLFVGRLNFYFDSQLAERWRALAEVRFTYLPQGSWYGNDSGLLLRQEQYGADYTDFTRDRPLGSLMIQRAFIEYSATAWLSVKAGQFLTPYGVWNIDHGSPVIIGVSPPFLVGARLLPESQVGLLGYGRVSLVDDWDLSYALGLSNGRTELTAYEDLDSNKAITARLALTYRGAGELTVGTTLYAGKATDNTRTLYFDATGPKARENILYQVSERAHAFDLRWIWGDLHVQSEAIVRDRKYTERGRPTLGPGFEPDQREAGVYALVGYRTPLAGIMPYVKGEYSPDPALRVVGITQNVMLGTGGINFRPVPRVVFKVEYNYGFFPNAKSNTFADNYITALDMQIAWAF